MKKYLSFFGLLFVAALIAAAFLIFVFFFLGEEREVEEDVALIINGREFSGEDLDLYRRMVAREDLREGDGDMSQEEIEEEAINRIVRRVVLEEYLEDSGITVTDEGVKKQMRYLAGETPGVETVEEFIDYQIKRGYFYEEIEKEVRVARGIKKLIEMHEEQIEITEEEIEGMYQSYLDFLEEDESPRELEDMKEEIKEILKEQKITAEMINNLEERREAVEVIILD